ncbi:MAG: DUF5989 family protein [Planctomycetes bacterium]|nr:DUF5989 family protein [Planctomycetota bacterium]
MTDPADKNNPDDFESQARDESSGGIVAEFIDFLKNNKSWWLIPIILVLLLVAAFLVLGGTAAAPFIYTLF